MRPGSGSVASGRFTRKAGGLTTLQRRAAFASGVHYVVDGALPHGKAGRPMPEVLAEIGAEWRARAKPVGGPAVAGGGGAALGKITSNVSDRGIAAELASSALPPQDLDERCAGAGRLARFKLLDRLRRLSQPRTAACRARRIASSVQIQCRPGGSVAFSGVLSCGSVWGCPVCSARICAHRVTELQNAATIWTTLGGSIQHVTFTVRHGLGDSLEELRSGVSEAWRLLWQGRAAAERKDAWGIAHSVRGLEITDGSTHGFHPHLHVLFFLRPGASIDIEALSTAWREAVCRSLGVGNAPSAARGVEAGAPLRDNDASRVAAYLAKLGLEVGNPASKGAKLGNRTQWELAQDAATGDAIAAERWQILTREMKGARQLTWSRNTRQFFRLRKCDEVDAGDPSGVGFVLAEWEGNAWDARKQADPFWVSRVAFAAWSDTPLSELLSLGSVVKNLPPGIVSLVWRSCTSFERASSLPARFELNRTHIARTGEPADAERGPPMPLVLVRERERRSDLACSTGLRSAGIASRRSPARVTEPSKLLGGSDKPSVRSDEKEAGAPNAEAIEQPEFRQLSWAHWL